jgi:hypothetical protein
MGLPLVISLLMTLGTIVIHALALAGILYFIRWQDYLKRTSASTHG